MREQKESCPMNEPTITITETFTYNAPIQRIPQTDRVVAALTPTGAYLVRTSDSRAVGVAAPTPDAVVRTWKAYIRRYGGQDAAIAAVEGSSPGFVSRWNALIAERPWEDEVDIFVTY